MPSPPKSRQSKIQNPKSKITSRALITLPRCSFTPTSARFSKLTFDQWLKVGRDIGALGEAHQWWLGDWAVAGQRQFGEPTSAVHARYLEVMRQTGYAIGTISNFASIARAFPPSRRREGVPWSHHCEIAGKLDDPAAQDRFLKLCADREWTLAQLRQAISLSLPEPKVAPIEGTAPEHAGGAPKIAFESFDDTESFPVSITEAAQDLEPEDRDRAWEYTAEIVKKLVHFIFQVKGGLATAKKQGRDIRLHVVAYSLTREILGDGPATETCCRPNGWHKQAFNEEMGKFREMFPGFTTSGMRSATGRENMRKSYHARNGKH